MPKCLLSIHPEKPLSKQGNYKVKFSKVRVFVGLCEMCLIDIIYSVYDLPVYMTYRCKFKMLDFSVS